MRVKFLSMAAAAVLSACTGAATASDGYKFTAQLSDDEEGATAFLVDFDNGEKIDSVTVEDNKAVFVGKVDAPICVRLIVDGNRYGGSFILENSELIWGNRKVKGSPLNAEIDKIQARLSEFNKRYEQLPDSASTAVVDALVAEYMSVADSAMTANINNPIGYMLLLEKAYNMSADELRGLLSKYPAMKRYVRVNKVLAAAENKEKTQPGKKFVDFTVTNDSVSQSLSDYVGKGKFTLVDFWASWCGPCIRETKVIKRIYEEFGPKGLDVLGVAVWDEPENTLRAIEQHQLPWKQIINAQTIPTDLYGISGIPCIILFGPDGTILSRDKQDEELVNDVRAAFEGKLEVPATVD